MKALLAGLLIVIAAPVAATAANSKDAALTRFVVEIDLHDSIELSETRSIGLSEALDEALAQNLTLALARADEQIAAENRFVAQATLYPSLEVGFRARRLDGRVQGSFGLLRDVAYSTYAGGTALVYRANIAARLQQSFAERRNAEAVQLDRLDTEQRMVLQLVEHFQNLMLAGVAVQITHDVVVGSERFLQVVRARAAGGLTLGTDVARAEAKLASDRQELVAARNQFVNASTRIAVVLRADVDIVLVPADARLEVAPDSRPSLHDPQVRPDVQAAGRRNVAAERRVTSAKWDLYLPELRAELSHVEIGDTIDDLQGRDERAALVLWNLSPVGFRQIRQRRAEEQRARLQLAQAENRAAGEVRRAEQDLAGARDRIPLAGDGVRAASDSLRLSEARFKAGTAIALEVFDAQIALAQARFALARAIVDYNVSRARLLAASGTIDRTAFE